MDKKLRLLILELSLEAVALGEEFKALEDKKTPHAIKIKAEGLTKVEVAKRLKDLL